MMKKEYSSPRIELQLVNSEDDIMLASDVDIDVGIWYPDEE